MLSILSFFEVKTKDWFLLKWLACVYSTQLDHCCYKKLKLKFSCLNPEKEHKQFLPTYLRVSYNYTFPERIVFLATIIIFEWGSFLVFQAQRHSASFLDWLWQDSWRIEPNEKIGQPIRCAESGPGPSAEGWKPDIKFTYIGHC